MAYVLLRHNFGPFVYGAIHAEKNQDIEVENDETHWVGHDRFLKLVNDPSQLRGRFRITIPAAKGRTETVNNDETITIHANRTETVSLQNLLRPGARFSNLEFATSTKGALGLRATDVTIHQVGMLRDGGKWASASARGIIAILIGL